MFDGFHELLWVWNFLLKQKIPSFMQIDLIHQIFQIMMQSNVTPGMIIHIIFLGQLSYNALDNN